MGVGTEEDVKIIVDQLQADRARIKIIAPSSCKQKSSTQKIVGETALEKLRDSLSGMGLWFDAVRLTQGVTKQAGDTFEVCGKSVMLDKINIGQVAKVRIEPLVRGTRSTTNVSVTIGIEKRAIKLSPNKTLDRINEINQTIQKWERD